MSRLSCNLKTVKLPYLQTPDKDSETHGSNGYLSDSGHLRNAHITKHCYCSKEKEQATHTHTHTQAYDAVNLPCLSYSSACVVLQLSSDFLL